VEANCIESARGIEYYMVINFKAWPSKIKKLESEYKIISKK